MEDRLACSAPLRVRLAEHGCGTMSSSSCRTPGGPVYRASPQRGDCRAITTLGAGERGHARPVSLMDGRHFVFQSWPTSTATLYMADLDVASHARLATRASSPAFVEPDRLVYLSGGSLVAQRLDL